MSGPRDQHITPKLLVRRFKREGSPLFVIDEEGELREKNEAKAITSRHHYNLKGESSKKFDVETALGVVEGSFGEVLKKIEVALEAGEYIHLIEHRDATFNFIILAIVRSFEFNAEPSEAELDSVYRGGVRAAVDKFGPTAVAGAIDEEAKNRIIHNSRKQAVLKKIGKPEDFIRGLNLSLAVVRGDCEFITGSCPISLDVPVACNLVIKHRLVLPIGRKLALIGSDDPANAKYILSCKDVDAVNSGIARQSKIIAGSSQDLIERYRPQRAKDV